MAAPTPEPWWKPEVFAARAPMLRARARIKDAVRRHFLDEGFTEVETPALVPVPGMEVHLQGFRTTFRPLDGEPEREPVDAT